jgi:hypothetical protein
VVASGEFLRGPKWSMLTALGLQRLPVNKAGRCGCGYGCGDGGRGVADSGTVGCVAV